MVLRARQAYGGSVTDSPTGIPFHPYLLAPPLPRLNGRTYLPVEAVPVELDGLTVGWLWRNDDDRAADCEFVPFDMVPYGRFDPGRWSESVARRVADGMSPSAAVGDVRAHGVDPAPAHRGEPGTIDPEARVVRLPFRHFLHLFGGYGSRNRPRNDGLVFKLSGSYADTVPPETPVTYVPWERDGVVMGWLWWNDDLDASWHVPNVFEPSSRIRDGRTLVFNHPWAHRMKDLRDEGHAPGSAVRELRKEGGDGEAVTIAEPQRAESLEQLRVVIGYSDYVAAAAAFHDHERSEHLAREAAEAAYYEAHPDEAVPLPGS
ncbi:hypothetical protein AS850_03450 [Frondihabitans sp. 762G35]|nr:hypothetical protein AS850_03450 [Frondihabitans sp. 762G35]